MHDRKRREYRVQSLEEHIEKLWCEYEPCCISGHSALRPLQLRRPKIMTSYTDATGRHPVRLHSLLAGPHPRSGKIDDHRISVAEVHLVRRLTIECRMGNGMCALT